ncbi:hypothetical protein ACLF3G_21505 [Falsiroseomonas sp. HC035]|uniref:hypothetical protein n=1 Tax=Falsiroseomonas sp. HC035 TaxID=3390999 RepID=UPI003D31E932
MFNVKWGSMERHVERLLSSCSLAQFSYRTWPAPGILAPSAPLAPAEPLPGASSRLLVVAAPSGAEAVAAATPGPPPAETPSTARTRTLLASFSRLIEDPQPAAPTGPAVQQSLRRRGPLALPPAEGFEAPIHVGYRPPRTGRDRRAPADGVPDSIPGVRPAGKPDAGQGATPGRRFALLEEMLPDPSRRPDRRNAPRRSAT